MRTRLAGVLLSLALAVGGATLATGTEAVAAPRTAALTVVQEAPAVQAAPAHRPTSTLAFVEKSKTKSKKKSKGFFSRIIGAFFALLIVGVILIVVVVLVVRRRRGRNGH